MELTFEKHPIYKDSGLEWLGEIPENWTIHKFKNAFAFSKGLNITKENLEDEGIPCVNYGEVHSKYGFEVDPSIHVLKFVNKSYVKTSPKSLLQKGDFIFADTSEDIEGSGNFTYLNSDDKTFAGYHTVIAKPRTGFRDRYLAYLFDSSTYRTQIRKKVKGVKVYSITNGILKDTLLWLPPTEHRIAIANFLDAKTTKIDKVIRQKEQLIKLLKERKQIIIQNAVTKGLDSNVKLKDSGVEWIGEIPEHWKLTTNKILFTEQKNPGREDLPLLSVSIHSAVSSGELSDDENIRGKIKIEDKSNYKHVNVNDIVFNMMRAWQGAIGAVRIEGMVSPAYVVAKPNSKIKADYFEFQYRTEIFIQQMSQNSKGITDFRKRLYWDEFKQLNTILPPVEEQESIVLYIETQSAKVDKAISLQEQQIDKLKEYKTVLIDNAVTGKIKVC